MSSMTECNFCSLRHIRTRAEREGKTVTLSSERAHVTESLHADDKTTRFFSTTVFVHPKDVDVLRIEGIDTPDHPNREKYFVAWFMELSDSCACD